MVYKAVNKQMKNLFHRGGLLIFNFFTKMLGFADWMVQNEADTMGNKNIILILVFKHGIYIKYQNNCHSFTNNDGKILIFGIPMF